MLCNILIRYAIDLIAEIAEILKFNYTFKWVDDGAYGYKNKETGEWNGLMGELLSQVCIDDARTLKNYCISTDRGLPLKSRSTQNLDSLKIAASASSIYSCNISVLCQMLAVCPPPCDQSTVEYLFICTIFLAVSNPRTIYFFQSASPLHTLLFAIRG